MYSCGWKAGEGAVWGGEGGDRTHGSVKAAMLLAPLVLKSCRKGDQTLARHKNRTARGEMYREHGEARDDVRRV